MTSTTAPTLLPALTGLRFVAALWVVGYHVLRPWISSTTGPARDLLAGAPVAVTLFFVLSGFVLTWVYAGPARARGRLEGRAFAAARISRVLPLYVFAVLVAVPVGVVARQRGLVEDGYSSLLFVATATQAWVPDAALRWNPPLWSVSVEVAFYLAFPLLLPLVLRASRRALVVAGGLAWAASVALGALYLALDPDGLGEVKPESVGTWLFALRFNPLVRAPDLLLGMVAARLFLDGARLPSSTGLSIVVGAAALLSSGAVPIALLHGSLLSPAMAALVVSLATSTGPFARLLSTTLFQRLGETSYALYALHLPVWMWMAGLAKRPMDQIDVAFSAAVAVASILVALLAHALVERPARERLRRLLARR